MFIKNCKTKPIEVTKLTLLLTRHYQKRIKNMDYNNTKAFLFDKKEQPH